MNTRFNPTVNGELHLGHLCLILLNVQVAKENGGQFICRFDDIQNEYLGDHKLSNENLQSQCERIMEELDWLKIKTTYSFASKEQEKNEQLIKPLGGLVKTLPLVGARLEHALRGDYYPYTPYWTALRTAHDYREQIDPLIRGDDLTSEFSLYCYFCNVLGFPIPRICFIPKLHERSGNAISNISKTSGNHSIEKYRKSGYGLAELVEMVEHSYLEEPKLGWHRQNIKKNPILAPY